MDEIVRRTVSVLANVPFVYNIPPGATYVLVHTGEQLNACSLTFNAGDQTNYSVFYGWNPYHVPPSATQFTISGPSDFEAVVEFSFEVTGVGPSGVQGPIGPQGIQGNTGPSGATGPTGATGPAGPSGPQGTAGPQGSQGPAGTQGPVGPSGADGNTILSGSGPPSGGTGVIGDFYIDKTNNMFYGPKTGSGWGSGTQMAGVPGPQGPAGPTGPTGATGSQGPQGNPGATGSTGPQGNPGADGKTVLNGTTVPSSGLGSNGDFYIRTTTNEIYGPKTAGAWGSPTSLVGPQGPQGNQGPTGSTGSQGPAGTNGNTVLNGTSNPTVGVGVNGDFYINTTSNTIWGPKAAGAWPGSGTSLVGPQGTQGIQGIQGIQGPTGSTGPAGAAVLNGTSNPTSGVGNNGDFYINTTTNFIWGPKSGGAWPGSGVSLVGPTGSTGAAGNTVLNGTAVPAGGTGANGDFYIRTTTNEIYGPKTAGAWGSPTSMIGPQGPTGATGSTGAPGSTGPAGADGKTVLNGTSDPTGGVGTNGDFYINTSTNKIFGPKSGGVWPTGVSLVGPQGPTGATGSTGSPGSPGANGSSVLNGTSNPTSGVGADGDFYINTTNYTIWGPKASGAWPGSGVSLVGPSGSGSGNVSNVGTPTSGQLAQWTDTTHIQGVDVSTLNIPAPATATPLVNGTAAVGTTTKYAREDHIHPTDTSRQASDATLTALAGLDSTTGLVEETAADTFTKRAIGVGASTSIPTRADGDARWQAAGSYQPLDATLTALAGLDSTTGLVEETAADTFTKRALGVAASTSVPTRADADARYAAISHTHAESDITNLVSDLAAKAPLASPALTGNPTAPTATAGDNDTSIATTAFVTTAVTNAAVPSPATVAPLMDGSAAVGTTTKYAREDHVHPSDTTKANLASPTFTGTPAAPTATAGTATTQLATTAFVGTAITNAAVPSPATVAPIIDGTATVGVATKYAREDHIHPTDTSRQASDATLTALAGLDSTTGLVEETAADTFTKRAIGVGATTSIPTRADGDARWQTLDATLTALAGLNATAGLVEQTAADTFTKRLIGVANATDIPTRADADARYAVLASPTFTGDPKAPTPTAGDNDTSIATTAFVATSFAPLASPSLTGNPVAPTASVGDNDTSIATTNFVMRALGSLFVPQGRLTLTANTPVLRTTVTAQTTIRYTPYAGLWVPNYNGTDIIPISIGAEITQATTDTTKSPAAVVASKNYDMFVWNDAGTIRCTRGPAWSSDTARGTGAGTTELNRTIGGFYTNAVAITNGPAANRGTYVGSFRSNASSQVDWSLGGTSNTGIQANLTVWNMYNRSRVVATCRDNQVAYNYALGWRAAGGGSANLKVNFLMGLDEDHVEATYTSRTATAATSGAINAVGILIDAQTGTPNVIDIGHSQAANGSQRYPAARWTSTDATASISSLLGYHYLQAMEFTDSTTHSFNTGTDQRIFGTFMM